MNTTQQVSRIWQVNAVIDKGGSKESAFVKAYSVKQWSLKTKGHNVLKQTSTSSQHLDTFKNPMQVHLSKQSLWVHGHYLPYTETG